jgi:hypothetical protein
MFGVYQKENKHNIATPALSGAVCGDSRLSGTTFEK